MQWPEVVTAVATAVIALLLAFPALASFLLFRELRRAVSTLERFGDTIEKEIMPTVKSARARVWSGRRLMQ